MRDRPNFYHHAQSPGHALTTLCRSGVLRRLRLYAMHLQSADVDDLTQDVTLRVLQRIREGLVNSSGHLRATVWLAARSAIVDMIECRIGSPQRITDEPAYHQGIPNDDDATENFPLWTLSLIQDYELRLTAVALTRAETNADAAALLGISVRTLQRRKYALAECLSLFRAVDEGAAG